jgi:NADH-quinone oxidoreductase E subunit
MTSPNKSHSHSQDTFTFTESNLVQAHLLISRYPQGRQQSAVLPLLDLVQRQEGWVSTTAMDYVAKMLDMAPIRVYEVASFYTMIQRQPVGRHHVQVCTNLPCMLRGSQEVLESCRHSLNIDVGETTPDGLFTLSEVECLGACVNAPAIWIGDDYYEDLTPENTRILIDTLRKGQSPKPGSQIGRQASAPVGGLTSLTRKSGSES